VIIKQAHLFSPEGVRIVNATKSRTSSINGACRQIIAQIFAYPIPSIHPLRDVASIYMPATQTTTITWKTHEIIPAWLNATNSLM
jgi:hypothetical protein